MERSVGLQVPAAFTRPSNAGTAAFICVGLAMFLLPAAATQLVLRSELAAGLKFVLVPALVLLAGQGLHVFGIIGHDGMHFNLHRKRVVSAVTGILVSSFIPFHSDLGFALWHSRHHRWTNTDQDPDIAIFRRHRTFLTRLLLARPTASRQHLRETVRIAFGREPVKVELPLSLAAVRSLARFNLLCSCAWLAAHVYVTLRWPAVGIFSIWLPYAATVMMSGIRPYVEHAGTGHDKFENSRTWSSPFFDFFFLGHNYHLAHHLVPRVPTYRLRSFHRWLERTGHFDGRALHQESTIPGFFSYARAGSDYPEPPGAVQPRPSANSITGPRYDSAGGQESPRGSRATRAM
jgi:fatty acid desaturase